MRRYEQLTSANCRRVRLFLLPALSLLVLSCADRESADLPKTTTPSLGEVSVEQLHDTMQADAEITLVDVRTPAEWEAVRATDIKRFVPHDELPDRYDELGVDKQTPVCLICRSGRRSGLAGAWLVNRDYKNVFNVLGGTSAWVAAGYPTSNGPVAAPREEDSP